MLEQTNDDYENYQKDVKILPLELRPFDYDFGTFFKIFNEKQN